MSDYTPTLYRVRQFYIYANDPITGADVDEHDADFDRFLAAHDAEVARKTLEDAADEIGATADQYAATAERLHEEQQYGDSIRYSNYATAYRASSHKVRARAASISTDKAVLVTHPHDGHGPNDTCLLCSTDKKED